MLPYFTDEMIECLDCEPKSVKAGTKCFACMEIAKIMK
jgi:hypothetical protein